MPTKEQIREAATVISDEDDKMFHDSLNHMLENNMDIGACKFVKSTAILRFKKGRIENREKNKALRLLKQ